MSRIILQLEPAEPKLWVTQKVAAPQQAQSLPQAGVRILGETIDRDGVGIGIGITALMFLAVATWAIVQMSKNLDPAKIALKVSDHIRETQDKLQQINSTTTSSDRKIDLLMSIAEKNALMLREARELGLDMSGQLHQIERTVATAIKSEIAKK